MSNATENGRLEVMKFLHDHRTEGCTQDAMDLATEGGHFDVVKWLHETRNEGCSPNAMQLAAANGYFEIPLFLRANRSEDCGPDAVTYPAQCIESMEIVQWLGREAYHDAVDIRQVTSRDSYTIEVFKHALGAPTGVKRRRV